MIGESVNFFKGGSLVSDDDHFLSQILDLIMSQSIEAQKLSNQTLEFFLSERRKHYQIDSPLNQALKKADSLEKKVTDPELKNLISQTISLLEEKQDCCREEIFNILTGQGPEGGKLFDPPDKSFRTDIKHYIWLIKHSARTENTIILDKLGIYGVWKEEVQLADSLNRYINFLIELADDKKEALFEKYYRYLADALSYIHRNKSIGTKQNS